MIIVTGGLGHIGSILIRRCSKEQILIIDSLETQRYVSLFNLPENSRVTFLNKRVQDVSIEELHKYGKATSIVHLAAHNEALRFQKSKESLIENNLGATYTIAGISAEMGIPLIFPSSTSVYTSCDLYTNEESEALFPQSTYAKTKLMEENYLKQMASNGATVRILRFGTIYGVSPGMRFHTAVNSFCFQHSIGNPITIWGNATKLTRPYLSLLDACRSIEFTLQNFKKMSHIHNVASQNMRLSEIINIISNISGREVQINEVVNDIMNDWTFGVDTGKIESLGFEFKGDIEIGIKEILQLFKGLVPNAL